MSAAEEGRIAANLAYFARGLRAAGIPVGPGQVLDAARALAVAGIGPRADFYWTLHALFVKKREHSALFDQAFRLFWRRRGLIERLMAALLPVAPGAASREKTRRRISEALIPPAAGREKAQPRVHIEASFTTSDAERLQTKDFEEMTSEEIALARRAIRRLALSDDLVTTRRLAPDQRGALVDPRRTFRKSLRGGGALISLARRERGARRPPIVALCDISGSMSNYTRLFLQFLHALMDTRRSVHVFLFGTRLTNVTRQLRHKDPDEALAACAKAVPDWSGGTRIATSLAAFNRDWSRRVLGQGATVLLLTDGLERDDTDLEPRIARLARSCRRLVWLNPLLRYEGFEPRARGVRIILPHVDEFRPVHNLASIARLVDALSGRDTIGVKRAPPGRAA